MTRWSSNDGILGKGCGTLVAVELAKSSRGWTSAVHLVVASWWSALVKELVGFTRDQGMIGAVDKSDEDRVRRGICLFVVNDRQVSRQEDP